MISASTISFACTRSSTSSNKASSELIFGACDSEVCSTLEPSDARSASSNNTLSSTMEERAGSISSCEFASISLTEFISKLSVPATLLTCACPSILANLSISSADKALSISAWAAGAVSCSALLPNSSSVILSALLLASIPGRIDETRISLSLLSSGVSSRLLRSTGSRAKPS